MSKPILSLVNSEIKMEFPRTTRQKATLLGLACSGLLYRNVHFLLERYELEALEGLAMELEDDLKNQKPYDPTETEDT